MTTHHIQDDINAVDSNGDTLLHKAVKNYSHDEIPSLLERRASIATTNNQGYTPLHLAILLKNDDAMHQFLRFDANAVTYQNSRDGLTPLQLAAKELNIDATKMLLEAGASPFFGVPTFSLYYLAITANEPMRQRFNYINYLLDNGVKINSDELDKIVAYWDDAHTRSGTFFEKTEIRVLNLLVNAVERNPSRFLSHQSQEPVRRT